MRNDVISLKRSIEAHELKDLLFRKMLDSYLFALDRVWSHNCELPGALPQPRLPELEQLLRDEPTVSALDESRAELEVALRRLVEANRWQEGEIRQILKTLAQATASLTDKSTHYNNKLKGLATELETLASTDDLLLLRVGLQSHVAQFRECIEEMHADQRGGLEKLTSEMRDVRERLRRVEAQSTTDMLTGLVNRQSVEARINELICECRPFSIILLDLNRFKAINDRFGHLAGDAALREFSTRLKGAVRARDMASRWGGDEFLVVVDAALPDAINVSRRLMQAVNGRYSLMVNSNPVKLDITTSVGMAEYRLGDRVEQLFARADACLYEAKGPR